MLGFVFLGLALLGVMLPLMPTTPFVLVAAACFARSSARWHQWLLANGTFGPMIRDWERRRCIGCRVKAIAIGSMIGVGGFSVLYAVESAQARIGGGTLIALGIVTVLMIRT
ncbi:MAG: DUF454 family protein, partial [Xanthomonadales bacterium]|nr:DUF454 family protein [Xanthomonadales bacterium]NIN58426.1 DUF454 family protein [Xanthomonadales bacterium]NIN73763.1 DUF454 family protein [Xanthomonadales bacterium]NIO13733.1 DUF454 family protein [Xanthomonadales bacterium]NIP10819.1 DUF454 family protein [Xanthomonadales bacterium]